MSEQKLILQMINAKKIFRIPTTERNLLSYVQSIYRHINTQQSFTLFENLNLSIYAGEVVGIVGPNGSGKSTLLRCLAGIYSLNSGSISRKGSTSCFFEGEPSSFPNLSVSDHLIVIAALSNLNPLKLPNVLTRLRGYYNLDKFLNLPIKDISIGMTRRITMAFLEQLDTELIIIDEFMIGADLNLIEESKSIIKRLKNQGKSIILSSHNHELLADCTDRLVKMPLNLPRADFPTSVFTNNQ
jgi:ABC-type polysaccharide/polyol phosphate transport system ATPase subunit